MTNLKYILDDIARGETVYVLHPKKYQIQPLFYGKMGIELNIDDDPSTMDTPWGTTRQVTDLCLGGGDLEDFMGYYQYYGLFWLKQYIKNILQHFQRCVKEFLIFHWLLDEIIHHTMAFMYK